jgi:predicted dehydrogenase
MCPQGELLRQHESQRGRDGLRVGVVGVGTMGRHHARVYSELPDTQLVGVSDADAERARSVADEYGTDAYDQERLLSAVDAVSVAVPTRYHTAVATAALDASVSVLVEKPVVTDPEEGRELRRHASGTDAVVQVGHVERFNPAVESLRDVLASEDGEVLAIDARRQGPPVDRDSTDSVVMDLMIHDIDLLTSLVPGEAVEVNAVSAADGRHVVATFAFESGVGASLTASRVSQQRVRELVVSAADYQVEVDYQSQSVRIHRDSFPEYVADDGDLRYRNESLVERPMVSNGEPLKAELAAFVDCVQSGSEPAVTLDDGLRAVEIAQRVEAAAVEGTTTGALVSGD